MNKEQFDQYIRSIKSNLDAERLHEALKIEENVLYTNPSWPFLDDVISIRQAYHGLLSCMEQGFQDPSRKEQFNWLMGKTYHVLHQFERHYKLQDPYSIYKKSANEDKHLPLEEFTRQLEQFQLALLMNDGGASAPEARLKEQETIRHQLFLRIWTSPEFTTEDMEGLRQFFESVLIAKNDKAACLGALLLHELLTPDIEPLKLMTQLATTTDTPEELQVRALANVILCMLVHHKEYKHQQAAYKPICKSLRTPELQEKTFVILQQIFLTIHSRTILERIQQDLMPLMYGPDALSGSVEKIRQASMQLQRLMKKGVDVQYASMYHEKKHEFFKWVDNWFLPFDPHHSLTDAALKDPKFASKELDVILKNPTICDSDRWSIFFKIKQANIPVELTGISSEELEMVDMRATAKSLIRNYMADLFRFYTIFTYHQEFESPFTSQRLPESCLDIIALLFDAEHQLKLGSHLSKTEFYGEAIQLVGKYTESGPFMLEANTLMAEICLTGLKDKKKALQCYQKAIALKSSDDLKHKLAICYQANGAHEEAASIFLELLEEDSENSQLLKETTSSLVKSYAIEQAIPLLYKLAYLDEEKYNDYAYGQLAWCYLAQDKLEESWAAFEHIKERSLTDMLLGGKICWAMQDYKNAIDFFKYFIRKSPDETKAMGQFFEHDELMRKYNLREFELQLIWDITHKD